MKDFRMSLNPKYTEQMYNGDQPAGIGHGLPGGGYADRWDCWYGCGETSGDSVLNASVKINHKISVFVCGDLLQIIDIRHSGKHDVWGYDSRGEFTLPATSRSSLHSLEHEKIERIRATELPGRFWWMVQNRALEIYNETKAKHKG